MSPDDSNLVDRVTTVVAPVLDGLGIELVDVEYNSGVVRIVADRAGGIDLDALRSLTRAVSEELDDADPIPGRYTLEVSSPGLERPLRTADHFRRSVGADVKVKTRPDVEGERRVRGTLVAADDDGFEIDAADVGVRRFGYDEVMSARTVFDWGPAPKPSSKSKSNRREAAEQ